MRGPILILLTLISVGSMAGCATGGLVVGDGTATGGAIEVGVETGDIEPCINLTGSVSGDCKVPSTPE